MLNCKKNENNTEEEPSVGLKDTQSLTHKDEKSCYDKQDWTPEEICCFDSISAN